MYELPPLVAVLSALLLSSPGATGTGVTKVIATGDLMTTASDVELQSLDPEHILDKLDLPEPAEGDRVGALTALLGYYRAKYPLAEKPGKASASDLQTADNVVKHIFQWGPYEAADYGEDIDWEWDPRGDIEWVAAVYRFYWLSPLMKAYAATRDDKYARAFVELTSDWIHKHPLENRRKTHPVYTNWRGFAWLDIQTGIRATKLCQAFPTLVHGGSFTPEFLGILLASLYDHQVKTERLPMRAIHNKAVFEQRGFINIAYTFQEFKDSRRWLELALERTRDNFLAQTTADGVQREWSGGYHVAVLRDAVEIMQRTESAGVRVPDDYKDRIRKMYDYIFAIATPDLGFPMFGDAGRGPADGRSRSSWELYGRLIGATDVLGDPKYAARAKLDRAGLPKQTSYAFLDAGIYALRNEWGPDQIYFALHCAPPAISGHDQPDNGTFELYAYGRWLMTDSGYYTYGHDPAGRAWHRRTRVHQTLTLDGKDSAVRATQLLWHTAPDFDAVVVQNDAYKGLTHRRTVWFVDKAFFVLLDEAIGDAQGVLDLHFQLAVGDAAINPDQHWATTGFDDANVLVWMSPNAPVTMEEEEGWFAWKYGHRKPRKAFCYRHLQQAPAAFLTLLVPYRGTDRPQISAVLPEDFEIGADRQELQAQAFGKTWRFGRDLKTGQVWCNVSP